ncbi:MAG: enoyl-CoA hydratase-related protein [Akkermansiaceae bacterium]
MHIDLEFSDRIAVLIFDRKGASANALDVAVLEEISECLDELSERSDVAGLLIRSTKANFMAAGSELKEFAEAKGEDLEKLVSLGQVVFNRIADLVFPTVAILDGACVGGGFELALACDWRIASDQRQTEIGLPATRYGLLPAWGGASRLPDLLGLQEALPVLLFGETYDVSEAKRMGLVDETVFPEHLDAVAHRYIEKGKRHHTHNRITHNQAVATLTRVQAQKELQKNVRGRRLAAEQVLDVAVSSIGRTRAQSQQAELEAIKKLMELPETDRLIRQFFLKERARIHSYVSCEARSIHRAGLVGSGQLSAEIACLLSAHGTEVIFQGSSEEDMAEAMAEVSRIYLEPPLRDGSSTISAARGFDRIHPIVGQVPLQSCDLVLVTNGGDWAGISEKIRTNTVLVSFNMPMPLAEISSSIVHSEQLVGLNFFRPAHRVEVVEIVRSESTSEEVLASVIAFVRGMGRLPVVAKDSPGSLIYRIFMPYLAEAALMFERGGDPEEIDGAMRDFGMAKGPLQILDEMGLDIAMSHFEVLAQAFPDRFKLPEVLRMLIEDGHAGQKDGGGFYVYDDASPAVNAEAIGFRTGSEPAPQNTQLILSNIIIQEAKRCLEEHVCDHAEEVDLVVTQGIGYPATLYDSLA